MKSRVIFASLILGLGIAATASAATTISDDSPANSKSASTTMLTNGSEKQFSQYIEANFSRFARRSNWLDFMQVVTTYNQNPTAVLSLDADTRDRFNAAAAELNKRLTKEKSADASRYLSQATQTARMVNYLWNVTQNEAQAADDELVK